MEYIIRTVRPEDLEAVAKVENICFPAAEAAEREVIKQRIQTFPDSFFVAEKDGVIIGFINGAVSDRKTICDEMFHQISFHRPEGAYQSIFGLDVIPEFQRQGVAAALMRHMIRESEKDGRKGLILTCKDKLLSYYSKFGYKNLGVSASVHGGAVWYDMILEFDR